MLMLTLTQKNFSISSNNTQEKKRKIFFKTFSSRLQLLFTDHRNQSQVQMLGNFTIPRFYIKYPHHSSRNIRVNRHFVHTFFRYILSLTLPSFGMGIVLWCSCVYFFISLLRSFSFTIFLHQFFSSLQLPCPSS